jgi:hypothetical protein
MYLEFISEDARKSTKINVGSIEPALSDCGNECFWPNLPHLMLKKGAPPLTSISRTSLSCEIFLFLLSTCQNQKTSFEEITINYQEQSTYHSVNTKTHKVQVSYVFTRVRKLGKATISFFISVCPSFRMELLSSNWVDSH